MSKDISSSPSKPNAAPPILFILYTFTALLCWKAWANLSKADIWYLIFWVCSMTLCIVFGCGEKTKRNADLFMYSVVGFLIVFTSAALFIKTLKN